MKYQVLGNSASLDAEEQKEGVQSHPHFLFVVFLITL
jgi:hypothetical protein